MSKTSIACIALRGGKVLIAHRNPTGQMGGKWEFPGGKVEEGETDEVAICREMMEEFGISVKPVKKITESTFEHNGVTVSLHVFEIKVPHKGLFFKYKLTEHTEYKWVRFEEIQSLDFVDSDMAVYEDVKKYAEIEKGYGKK